MTQCQPNDIQCEINNCSGAIGSGTTLFNYWATHDCVAAYSAAINTGPTGALQYNPQAQLMVQNKIVQLFNTYFETNTITDNVTSPSFNNFQNTLLNLCINPSLPGICTQFLTGYCDGFSRAQATNSPILTDFCGCYVPPNENIIKFALGTEQCLLGTTGCMGCTAGMSGCTGQPSCDSLCHRALTSQKTVQSTGSFITCPQTICAIDQVTISAQSSSIVGGVNFNTVCSGCNAKNSFGCLCVVQGVNISGTLGQIGVGSENFNKLCGTNSVCLVEDNQGNIISEGGCSVGTIPVPPINIFPNWGIIFIMAVLVLIILFIMIAIRFDSQR